MQLHGHLLLRHRKKCFGLVIDHYYLGLSKHVEITIRPHVESEPLDMITPFCGQGQQLICSFQNAAELCSYFQIAHQFDFAL
jgi:hypothetical protein